MILSLFLHFDQDDYMIAMNAPTHSVKSIASTLADVVAPIHPWLIDSCCIIRVYKRIIIIIIVTIILRLHIFYTFEYALSSVTHISQRKVVCYFDVI